MRRSISLVSTLSVCCAALLGCGSNAGVDFFEGSAGGAPASGSAAAGGARSAAAGAADVLPAAGAPGTSGAPGVSGAPGGAGAGVASAGQAAGGSSAGSSGGPSDAPCGPVTDVTNMTNRMSGPFNTMGPVCLLVSTDISGWGCSNFEGRSVKVNGQPLTCAGLPLPDKLHGGYYFDISAGEHEYATIFWF